jgi:hypothetical protein
MVSAQGMGYSLITLVVVAGNPHDTSFKPSSTFSSFARRSSPSCATRFFF